MDTWEFFKSIWKKGEKKQIDNVATHFKGLLSLNYDLNCDPKMGPSLVTAKKWLRVRLNKKTEAAPLLWTHKADLWDEQVKDQMFTPCLKLVEYLLLSDNTSPLGRAPQQKAFTGNWCLDT